MSQWTPSGGGGSGGGSGDVAGPASSTDNAVVRFDGAGGKTLQDSVVTISDAGVVAGATQANVDNLRLDGNTISTTNANGNAVVAANGTGGLCIGGETSNDISLVQSSGSLRVRNPATPTAPQSVACRDLRCFNSDFATDFFIATNGYLGLYASGGPRIKFTRATNAENSHDAGISSPSAGVVLIDDSGSGVGGLQAARVVEASTAGSGAPNVLAVTESRKLITNTGATAECYNVLPSSAPIGAEFPFYCDDADGIRIVAPAGETIRIEGTASTAAGFIRSIVVGSAIKLTKVSAAAWATLAKPAGTWTIDI